MAKFEECGSSILLLKCRLEACTARPKVWLFLSPLRRGTTGGLSILGTPCRKERGVPLAKGGQIVSPAPRM